MWYYFYGIYYNMCLCIYYYVIIEHNENYRIISMLSIIIKPECAN